MTTWESIDNMENVTVTSDAAFERVSSDESFTDESSSGYLQQNTSWLVQEIPNISFLDIADTMLENHKTLYDRENWILRVGKAGRSIEAQPQDTVTLTLNENYTVPLWRHYIEYDNSVSSWNYTVCKPEQSWNISTINILQTWYYIISYWWTITTVVNNTTWVDVTVCKWDLVNPIRIIWDSYKSTQCPEILSWWRYKPNIFLNEWDKLFMLIEADSSIEIHNDTYLNVQFQQYNL